MCKKDVSDLKKIARLKKILDAAQTEASSIRSREPSCTEEEYDDYRYKCYEQASTSFWKVANSMEMDIGYEGWYSDDVVSKMLHFYEAYSEASWLAKALEEEDSNDYHQ